MKQSKLTQHNAREAIGEEATPQRRLTSTVPP